MQYTQRGQASLHHTFGNRPLLPSGPGGVELLTVAQDLTSRGADRVRTDDLLVANEALSQLSYSPGHCLLTIEPFVRKIRNTPANFKRLVRPWLLCPECNFTCDLFHVNSALHRLFASHRGEYFFSVQDSREDGAKKLTNRPEIGILSVEWQRI